MRNGRLRYTNADYTLSLSRLPLGDLIDFAALTHYGNPAWQRERPPYLIFAEPDLLGTRRLQSTTIRRTAARTAPVAR